MFLILGIEYESKLLILMDLNVLSSERSSEATSFNNS